MENALYYTLSTIAQTLAGTLAVLVAVVLFKLAGLGEWMNRGYVDASRTHRWPDRKRILEEWGFINRRLYAALGFSVVDISLCFLALPFTRWIACSPWASGAILCSAVGLGITSLCLYVGLIAAMVRRPAE